MPKHTDPRIARSLKSYVERADLATSYDSHYEDTPLLDFDTVFLAQELKPPGRVLDIGCGTGRHLISLSGEGHRCVGMDLSEHMIEISGRKLSEEGIEADLVRADMRDPLPFQDGTFDHVICMFSTMGLIPGEANRLAFVREVNRVMRPGGTFALHVHNRLYNILGGWDPVWLLRTYTWDRVFTDLEIGDRVMTYYRGVEGMYLHVFTYKEVKKLLAGGGFAIRRAAFLNDDREGEITGPLASIRANGFVIAAEKAPPEDVAG